METLIWRMRSVVVLLRHLRSDTIGRNVLDWYLPVKQVQPKKDLSKNTGATQKSGTPVF